MVAPIPKTKAEEIFEELSRNLANNKDIGDFRLTKYLKEISALKQTGVDLGMLWMCEGYIYNLKKQPEKMKSAFTNAYHYGMRDRISKYNQAAKYLTFGFFDEAAEGFSASHDEEAQGNLVRIAMSTFEFDKIGNLLVNQTYKDKLTLRKNALLKHGFNIDKIKEILNILHNLIRKENVHFSMVRQEFGYDNDLGITLYIEVDTELDKINSILNEYDDITSSDDFFETSSKLTIILLPFTNLEYEMVV